MNPEEQKAYINALEDLRLLVEGHIRVARTSAQLYVYDVSSNPNSSPIRQTEHVKLLQAGVAERFKALLEGVESIKNNQSLYS